MKKKQTKNQGEADLSLFEIRMIASPPFFIDGDSTESAMNDLWSFLYEMLEAEGMKILDLDIARLHITRKESK